MDPEWVLRAPESLSASLSWPFITAVTILKGLWKDCLAIIYKLKKWSYVHLHFMFINILPSQSRRCYRCAGNDTEPLSPKRREDEILLDVKMRVYEMKGWIISYACTSHILEPIGAFVRVLADFWLVKYYGRIHHNSSPFNLLAMTRGVELIMTIFIC